MNNNIFKFLFLYVIFFLKIHSVSLAAVSLTTGKNTDINLFGHVVDEQGEHIPFATVSIKGSTLGAACDTAGHYIISGMDEGGVTLVAQAIACIPAEHDIYLKPGQSYELNFTLKQDFIGIQQVVISANRNEINRRDAAVIVNPVTSKLFEASQSVCVADGLQFTPGLRVENNCQNCGFTQLRMNGLEGPYTQILINSKPVFSGLAGVYGLEQIPTNMIERVEIVRGGGSALFGGNAIGGTVNIITRDPIRNGFAINSNYGMNGFALDQGNGLRPDASIGFNVSAVTDDFKSGLYIFGMTRQRSWFDANDDGFSEMNRLKNNSAGFRGFYRPNGISKISFDFYSIHEDRRGGNKFESMPHESDITEQAQTSIYEMGLSYDTYTSKERLNKFTAFHSMQMVNRGSYYGALKDPRGYGHTDDFIMATGVQFVANNQNGGMLPLRTTMGLENNFGLLKDKKFGYLDPVTGERYDNKMITNQFSNTLGSFLQGEWDMGICVKLLAGLRLDYYHIAHFEDKDDKTTGLVLSPRLNLLYKVTEKVHARFSVSTGYRAPQIFNEDLHILSSGARRIIHTNDPDLTQENSVSFSSSVDYTSFLGNAQVYFLAEGFYNRLLNPFADGFALADSNSTDIIHHRSNVEGANVYGANFEFKIAPSSAFQLQGGFTIQESLYDVPVQWGEDEINRTREFLRAPDQYGYIVASYSLFRGLGFSTTGTYTGPMKVPHLPGAENNPHSLEVLKTSQHFFDMGFKVNYDFRLPGGITLQLNTGIQNLFHSYQSDFDLGDCRDAGYIYGPLKPRTISIGLKLGNL